MFASINFEDGLRFLFLLFKLLLCAVLFHEMYCRCWFDSKSEASENNFRKPAKRKEEGELKRQ